MKITTIDFDDAADAILDESDENYYRKIVCPVCGEIWLELFSEDAKFHYTTTCPHLKFIIEPDADDITYINKSTEAKLLKAVEHAWVKIQPSAAKLSGKQILQEEKFNPELWKKMELEEVNTLLDHTDAGGGGPERSFSIYFGAKIVA